MTPLDFIHQNPIFTWFVLATVLYGIYEIVKAFRK